MGYPYFCWFFHIGETFHPPKIRKPHRPRSRWVAEMSLIPVWMSKNCQVIPRLWSFLAVYKGCPFPARAARGIPIQTEAFPAPCELCLYLKTESFGGMSHGRKGYEKQRQP